MKKQTPIIILTIIIILTSITIVFAKKYYKNQYGYITTTSTASIKIKPKISKIYIQILVNQNTHSQTYDKLILQINNVTSYLKKNNLNKTIINTKINIYPNNVYINGKNIKKGYNGYDQISVTINSIKTTNKIIKHLLKNKFIQIQQIQPIIKNNNQYKKIIINKAIKKAIFKIKTALKKLRIKSFYVTNISINNNIRPIFRPIMMMATMKTNNNNIYNPKNQKLSITINIKAKYKTTKNII
jgi:uncharacterized protein YggE